MINTGMTVTANQKTTYERVGNLYERRGKSLGNKRNEIPESVIQEITKLYGDFAESEICKIFANEDFGYTKIVVERPLRDANGELILKKGREQADSVLRDTGNVPLTEDIEEYFAREVLPFAPDAWIDKKKSKVGYEIPFTRYFYKYEAPRPSRDHGGDLGAGEGIVRKSGGGV